MCVCVCVCAYLCALCVCIVCVCKYIFLLIIKINPYSFILQLLGSYHDIKNNNFFDCKAVTETTTKCVYFHDIASYSFITLEVGL